MGLFSFLTSRLGKLVAALLAAAGALLGAIQFGRWSQRKEDRVEDLESYIETKKEIDDVETSPDRDAAVERMRDNDWVR